MKREQVVVAAFFMCRALGLRASRREVIAIIAKVTGQGFRPDFVGKVLSSLRRGNRFGTTTEPIAEPVSTKITHEIGQNGTTANETWEPATLRYVISNYMSEANASDALNFFQTDSAPKSPVKRPRTRRQNALPLDERQREADHIFAEMRERIEAAIAGTMTWTEWRKRNRQVVLDWLAAGSKGEEILETWRAQCGPAFTPYSLHRVRNHALAAKNAPPPKDDDDLPEIVGFRPMTRAEWRKADPEFDKHLPPSRARA